MPHHHHILCRSKTSILNSWTPSNFSSISSSSLSLFAFISATSTACFGTSPDLPQHTAVSTSLPLIISHSSMRNTRSAPETNRSRNFCFPSLPFITHAVFPHILAVFFPTASLIFHCDILHSVPNLFETDQRSVLGIYISGRFQCCSVQY